MSSLIDIETDYEYVLGQVTGNVMNLEAMFQSGAWTRYELEKICSELVEAAHTFAAAQGLGGTRLDLATTAEPTDSNTVDFRNDAIDDYQRFYAGHIEYGHHDRGGGFVPARPFMRPAMYAVADATMGNLTGTVTRYLEAMWTVDSINFGHMVTSSNNSRAFYSRRNYMNKNTDYKGNQKSNRLTNQNPSRIKSKNESYSVNRYSQHGYSKDVKSNFGWK